MTEPPPVDPLKGTPSETTESLFGAWLETARPLDLPQSGGDGDTSLPGEEVAGGFDDIALCLFGEAPFDPFLSETADLAETAGLLGPESFALDGVTSAVTGLDPTDTSDDDSGEDSIFDSDFDLDSDLDDSATPRLGLDHKEEDIDADPDSYDLDFGSDDA